MQRLVAAAEAIVGAVSVGALLSFVLFTFTQVVLRYAFGSSLSWFDEINRYLFIWMVFLATSLAALEGSHIVIDVFSANASSRTRVVLSLVGDAAFVAFALIIGYGGLHLIQVNYNAITAAAGLRMGLVQAILPIFAVLATLFSIVHAWRVATASNRE